MSTGRRQGPSQTEKEHSRHWTTGAKSQQSLSRWVVKWGVTYNLVTSQVTWEGPSVKTRIFALFSNILTDPLPPAVWRCPLNPCLSISAFLSRTALQKQVTSELSSAQLITTSSIMASFMNGFLCITIPTTRVHSSARPKGQPWSLNCPLRS